LTRGLCDLERAGMVIRQVKGRRTYRIEITSEGRLALRVAETNEKASGVLIEALDKNKRAARVGVDQETMNALLAHINAMRQRAKTFDTRLRRDAFLFSDHPEGLEPWRPDSTSRKFARLMDELAMPYTLHALRHFHITELLTDGIDAERRLG
jgi:integrase